MVTLTAAGISHVTAFFDLTLFPTFGLPMTLPAHQPVAYNKQNRSQLKASLHTWIETRKRMKG